MAISFPPSPQADGTTYSYNGVTYVYALASDQWIVQGTGSSDLYVLKTGDTMTGSLTTVGYSGTTGTFSGNVSTKDLTSADATVDTLTSNGLVTAPFVTTATTVGGSGASSGSGKVVGYQQGIWTPTLVTGAAETVVHNTWSRVGNMVTVTAELSKFNNNGNIAINVQGLPYNASENTVGSVMTSKFNNPPNASHVSVTNISFFKSGADKNNGWSNLNHSDMLDANSAVYFCITYRTSNTDWAPINGATLT